MSANSRTGSFRRIPQPQRKDEKWWLPIPCVAPEGLSEKARKNLRQKRDSANQIHKAAMAINSSILAEMEIPHTYIVSLPKVCRPFHDIKGSFLSVNIDTFTLNKCPR